VISILPRWRRLSDHQADHASNSSHYRPGLVSISHRWQGQEEELEMLISIRKTLFNNIPGQFIIVQSFALISRPQNVSRLLFSVRVNES
jgi:hypothetical protein